mgnify:CR=1 FL=1
MRSSKDRTIQKKRVNKANKIAKTEASRKKRLANKAKREEILAINPNLKITIVDGVTHTDDGINGKVAVEVIDGKIRAITSVDYDDAVIEYQEVVDTENIVRNKKQYNAETDGGRAIDDKIEKERLFGFKALADRFKKKKISL